jgi:hypothetical protein
MEHGLLDSAIVRAHPYDTWLYRDWHLVECFINKIKRFRHIFSRFDNLLVVTWVSRSLSVYSFGYVELLKNLIFVLKYSVLGE